MRWVPAFGCPPGYEVSDKGEVRNSRGHHLSPWLSNGYSVVRIGGISRRVHRLVLQSFTNDRGADFDAAHLDGVRANNFLSNLTWATRTENNRHKADHGTQPRGESHSSAKLNPWDVVVIRLRHTFAKASYARLAADFELHRSTVQNICERTTWRHVP